MGDDYLSIIDATENAYAWVIAEDIEARLARFGIGVLVREALSKIGSVPVGQGHKPEFIAHELAEGDVNVRRFLSVSDVTGVIASSRVITGAGLE